MADIDVGRQAHLHTREAAFFAPFLQALGTGFFVSVALLTIGWLFRWRDIWRTALVVFVMLAALTWLGLQYRNLILTTLERSTGQDINGDGVIGKNEVTAEAQTVHVWVHEKSGPFEQAKEVTLDGSLTVIRELAVGLLNGRPMTITEWCGDGKPFSQGKFVKIRKKMFDEKMIKHINAKSPNDGYRLTKKGIDAMIDLVKQTSSPLPDD